MRRKTWTGRPTRWLKTMARPRADSGCPARQGTGAGGRGFGRRREASAARPRDSDRLQQQYAWPEAVSGRTGRVVLSFVIHNLGPGGPPRRVVSFSNARPASRVLRLARMMADGKASGEARRVRVTAKVLDDRRQRNAVAASRFCTHGHRQSGAGADRSPKAGLCQPEYLQAVRRWRRLLEWSEPGRPPARVVNAHIHALLYCL